MTTCLNNLSVCRSWPFCASDDSKPSVLPSVKSRIQPLMRPSCAVQISVPVEINSDGDPAVLDTHGEKATTPPIPLWVQFDQKSSDTGKPTPGPGLRSSIASFALPILGQSPRLANGSMPPAQQCISQPRELRSASAVFRRPAPPRPTCPEARCGWPRGWAARRSRIGCRSTSFQCAIRLGPTVRFGFQDAEKRSLQVGRGSGRSGRVTR